jgi:heme/copper-type cytochrome/quinol oxidase subunit 2
MTATVDRPAPSPPEPPPPEPSAGPSSPAWRSPAFLVLAAVSVIAVAALAFVAIDATRTNGSHVSMMRNMDRSSMMTGNSMMSGSMTPGSMMSGQTTAPATIPNAPQLAISATSFAFTPSELHVTAGRQVNIVLAAVDTMHDFTIEELGFKIVAHPGSPGSGGFTAPAAPGRYTFFCSIAGHRQAGMVGTLIVDPAS